MHSPYSTRVSGGPLCDAVAAAMTSFAIRLFCIRCRSIGACGVPWVVRWVSPGGYPGVFLGESPGGGPGGIPWGYPLGGPATPKSRQITASPVHRCCLRRVTKSIQSREKRLVVEQPGADNLKSSKNLGHRTAPTLWGTPRRVPAGSPGPNSKRQKLIIFKFKIKKNRSFRHQ